VIFRRPCVGGLSRTARTDDSCSEHKSVRNKLEASHFRH